MKKTKTTKIILALLGLVLLINIIGLIIEVVFGTGIIETEAARIRSLSFSTITLSLLFIATGITFGLKLFKLKTDMLKWWNIFVGIGALSILYKIIKPTYLTLAVPYYFIIFIGLTIIIWFLVSKHIKKILKRKNTTSIHHPQLSI